MSASTRAAIPLALLAAVLTVTSITRSWGEAAEAVDPADLPTVAVERRDLEVDHEAVGTLEPTGVTSLLAPVTGTVVEIAPLGVTIAAGSVVAVVDDRPVALLEGAVPAWRSLATGDVGEDVEQLEAALVAAGFDPAGQITVDDEFTSSTAAMVEDWQESIGAEPTGRLALGDVVFVAEPVRVESVAVAPGATVATGDVLLELATTQRVVAADVAVADATSLTIGAAVEVRLPDRSRIGGTVLTVAGARDPEVRAVTIAIESGAPIDLAGLGAVDVDVSWTEPVAEDVPTLPASAFRRLDDGSYVVDVIDGEGELDTIVVEVGRQVGVHVEVAGVPVDATVVSP